MFLMWTAKTDQTGQMPRLIRVFVGHKGHFVGFVMRWLIYISTMTQFSNMQALWCFIEPVALVKNVWSLAVIFFFPSKSI